MKVFLDTSAIIAFLNKDDIFNQHAYHTFKSTIEKGSALITTDYIVIETVTILKNRIGIEAVRAFDDEMLPVISVLWIDKKLHDTALSNLLYSGHRKISLVDFTSFEAMRKSGITHAFTFDKHFKTMGFTILS